MKKDIKKYLIGIIIGLIISSTSVVVAYNLNSSDVGFTPENDGWQVSTVEEALNSLYISNGKVVESLTFDLYADDKISATTNYGAVSVTTFSFPFEYEYAELTIRTATSEYAYVTITDGAKAGTYSTVSTITDITDMTSLSITTGTGYQAHYKCDASITFYF